MTRATRPARCVFCTDALVRAGILRSSDVRERPTVPAKQAPPKEFVSQPVRNPDHLLAWLNAAAAPTRAAAVDLLKQGFEDLEEDFGEEQFFAAARASYWAAADGSPGRTLAASLIQTLEV